MREAAVRAQLQRYVSPRLADMALGNPSLLDQPGDWREATVLFADIRGYTRLIETTPGPGRHPAARRLPHRDDRGDLPPPGHGRAAHRRRDRGPVRARRGRPPTLPRARCAPRWTWWRRCAALAARWAGEGLPRFDIGVGIASGPVMAGHHRLGRAARADRGRPPHDRGGAHPAHDTPVRRAYNRRRGARSARSSLVRHRELGSPRLKGLKERETLYEILGLREPVPATAERS